MFKTQNIDAVLTMLSDVEALKAVLIEMKEVQSDVDAKLKDFADYTSVADYEKDVKSDLAKIQKNVAATQMQLKHRQEEIVEATKLHNAAVTQFAETTDKFDKEKVAFEKSVASTMERLQKRELDLDNMTAEYAEKMEQADELITEYKDKLNKIKSSIAAIDG